MKPKNEAFQEKPVKEKTFLPQKKNPDISELEMSHGRYKLCRNLRILEHFGT